MTKTHETIADIIAWLRRPREGENAYLTAWRDEIADRLEAAHKRERGDAAKLREALVKCRDIALLWQVDEAAGVAGTTDKPHARSAAEAVIDIEFEINAALFATATAEKLSAVGDAAKLREAVKAVVDVGYPHNFQAEAPHIYGYCCDITRAIEKCFAALSAPPRNCDVGTPKEQDERFHRFCVKHHTGSCAGCHNPVGDYTVANGVRECALVWAQMPYEEGGVK